MKEDIFHSGDTGWKTLWKSAEFRLQLGVVLSFICFMASTVHYFFDYIEARSGPRIPDPVLDLFPNRDVSWLVFFILYSGVAIGLYVNLKKPVYLLLSLQTYVLVMLMRLVTLTFIPLDPPIGYIPLKEPIVQMFFTSDGRIISKDLFFSGHMSTLLALVFTAGRSIIRWVLATFAIILFILLLIQHVHYTIDLVAAPFGTWLAWAIAKKTIRRIPV